MPLIMNPHNRIFQGSNTATTGGTITLSVAAPVGAFAFRELYTNGATGVPLELYDATSGQFEFSYGTLVYGGGDETTDTIISRTIDISSSGSGVPIAWGAGTRNAICMVAAESFIYRWNNLADILNPATAWTNLGGGSAGKLSDYQLGFIPAGAGVDGAWTGGTNGKVVRFASANTLADASNTDTVAQLMLVGFKVTTGYYIGRNLITGLSGLTAGAFYYLGTSGNIVASTSLPVVTAGGSVKLVYIGYAVSTTSLLFEPKMIAKG